MKTKLTLILLAHNEEKTILGDIENINKNILKKIKNTIGDDQFTNGKFSEASDIFNNMSTSTEFEEFLTLPAYKLI